MSKLATALVAAHALLMVAGCSKPQPIPPNGVRCFTKTQRVNVRPNGAEWNGKYEVTRFVRFKSGEIVAPVLQVMIRRKSGLMGGLRDEPEWQNIKIGLNRNAPHLDLPNDDEIEAYIILISREAVKEIPDEGSSRIWEVIAKDISKQNNPVLDLPDFEDLPLLDARKDKDELKVKSKAALKYLVEVLDVK